MHQRPRELDRPATRDTSPPPPPPAEPSKWKTALIEAQFVAGGLVSHPAESTKHYSIIRHSHGLVWYQGPGTSIAITILASERLPPSRTVWLQERGYSGNAGMSIKALVGARGSWIDVTPAQEAQAHHVPTADERGIQRDVARFVKKATGHLKRHAPRETHLVRIPAVAQDGYFRLVLCKGGGDDDDPTKILCGSPVFRIASTSADAAVVRGASLSTMPLEVGVKVATAVGAQVVRKYTGVAGTVVQAKTSKVVAKSSVTKAAAVACRGVGGGIGSGLQTAVHDSWRSNRLDGHGRLINETTITTTTTNLRLASATIGSDDGPEPPFPIRFSGRLPEGTSHLGSEPGLPATKLRRVPDHIKSRLSGVFAAWVSCGRPPGPDAAWREAVVTIAPRRDAQPAVVTKASVSVTVAAGTVAVPPTEGRVDVLLMGYLHPAPPPAATADEVLARQRHDALVTVASLGRASWCPRETAARVRALRGARSLGDRLSEATGRVQQSVDRIPLHRAGVRSQAGRQRDELVGVGGIWVRRDG